MQRLPIIINIIILNKILIVSKMHLFNAVMVQGGDGEPVQVYLSLVTTVSYDNGL